MANDLDMKYRYQTVKVIRGREANKIAEMERQGWQVDHQTPTRLRTEITFRRSVAPTRFKTWMGVTALLGIGVILLGGVALAEAVGGGDDSGQATDKSPAASSTTSAVASQSPSELVSETPSESPSETPTATPTEQPSNKILTVKNSPALKKLLAQGENDAVCKKFATTYAGRTIEFDGSVATAGGGTYLVYAGDDSDTEYVPGPSFQFRTLTVDGDRPAPGDNLHFVAKVGAYNAIQGLFGLTQVATTQR